MSSRGKSGPRQAAPQMSANGKPLGRPPKTATSAATNAATTKALAQLQKEHATLQAEHARVVAENAALRAQLAGRTGGKGASSGRTGPTAAERRAAKAAEPPLVRVRPMPPATGPGHMEIDPYHVNAGYLKYTYGAAQLDRALHQYGIPMLRDEALYLHQQNPGSPRPGGRTKQAVVDYIKQYAVEAPISTRPNTQY